MCKEDEFYNLFNKKLEKNIDSNLKNIFYRISSLTYKYESHYIKLEKILNIIWKTFDEKEQDAYRYFYLIFKRRILGRLYGLRDER